MNNIPGIAAKGRIEGAQLGGPSKSRLRHPPIHRATHQHAYGIHGADGSHATDYIHLSHNRIDIPCQIKFGQVHPDCAAIRQEQSDRRARTDSRVPDMTAVRSPVLRFAYFVDGTDLKEILWTTAI
jgi:hypothetical protein